MEIELSTKDYQSIMSDYKLFPITTDMLGPHVTVNDINYMYVLDVIAHINMRKNGIDRRKTDSRYMEMTTNRGYYLPFDVWDFYNVTYHYSGNKPITIDTQFAIDNIITKNQHSKQLQMIVLDKSYTLFTRKYSLNTCGFIEHVNGVSNIHLGYNRLYGLSNFTLNLNTVPDSTVTENGKLSIPVDSYFKHAYLFKLPFKHDNNRIYENNGDLILVRDDAVYIDIVDIKDDKYISSERLSSRAHRYYCIN